MTISRSESYRWPVAIVGILFAQVAFGVWMARLAGADPVAVEPEYYKRAVAWDTTMAQARRDRALGWTAAASLTAGTGAGATLRVTVADSAGTPVVADSARIEAFAVAHSKYPVTLPLTRTADGLLTAEIPTAVRGLWEVRLHATRGADVFTAKLRTDFK